MIIRNITIKNFRSYYGTSTFEIGDTLTLIIGSNGDGKSTFYDAISWLLATDGKQIADLKLISKKRASELSVGDSDEVYVSMSYENEQGENTVVKSFRFTKSMGERISASNATFTLTKQAGYSKQDVSGMYIENDFPTVVRQFSMFKGETQLNVFKSSDSLKLILNTFSDVKGFEPYIKYLDDAMSKATTAAERARSKDRTNARKTEELSNKIRDLERTIQSLEDELRDKEKNSADLTIQLKNIEESRESSELLMSVNRRIDSLNSRKASYYADIKENYTARLLDEMWILMGYAPIAQEYIDKVHTLDIAKRKMNNEHQQQVGARKLAKKIELGYVPLAVNVPDQKTMEELLEDEVCKVCGRPAPKGSEPWLFMKNKLEEFLRSLNEDSEGEEEDPKFVRQYIEELANRGITLNNNLARTVTTMGQTVDKAISHNDKMHEEISRIDASLREAMAEKARILHGQEGMTEAELISAGNNISNMLTMKEHADRRIAQIKQKLPEIKEERAELVKKLRGMSSSSEAVQLENLSDFYSLVSDAFKEAKQTNKKNLLTKIEDMANDYLRLLNIGDFKGRIRIMEPSQDTAVAQLVDADRMEVTNPNTALLTTQYMAILFAISALSIDKNETEYPLFFDAPTSSFTEAKEMEFFSILSGMKKQMIVVTKSFLKDRGNGESILDTNRIKSINGMVYRIEKKRPFDDENLSTIQTVVSKIK